MKKSFMVLVVAILAAFAFSGQASANHVWNQEEAHFERFGNNYQYGRFIYFKDFTSQGLQYWDGNIAKAANGTWDFQNKWNTQLINAANDPYTFHLLLVDQGNNAGATHIRIFSTDQTTQWCSNHPGQAALGCTSTVLEDNGTHITYADVTLNNKQQLANGSFVTPSDFIRKLTLCHEIGHALGLGHTGTPSHMAMPGCMDVGTYHLQYNVPYLHDGNMFAYLYGNHAGANGPAPTGLPSGVTSKNMENTTQEYIRTVFNRMPAEVKAKVLSGEAEFWTGGEEPTQVSPLVFALGSL